MSASCDYDDALAAERAMNETYLRRLRDEEEGIAAYAEATVARPANTIWGRAAPNVPRRAFGPLIGRVVLDSGDSELADFYVAPARLEDESVSAVSWTAPVAGLLFEGRNWNPERVPDPDAAPDPQALLARRTFAARSGNIVSLSDDHEPGTDPNSVFRQDTPPPIPPPPATPALPPPPTPPVLPLGSTTPPQHAATPTEPAPRREVPLSAPPHRAPLASNARPPTQPSEPTGTLPQVEDHLGDQLTSDARSANRARDAPREHAVSAHGSTISDRTRSAAQPSNTAHNVLERAADLVMEALEKPRQDKLQSVLSTLQPDQYRYVTWPATEHLAIQGHPGTGKTIVATHRAAYLTHFQNETLLGASPTQPNNVALVGPTDQWATHVSRAIDEAGASGVEIISLEQLIRSLSDGLRHPLHRRKEQKFESDQKNVSIAYDIVRSLKPRLSLISDRKKQMQLVANELIRACADNRPLVAQLQQDHRSWLAEAKSYSNARRHRSYLLCLAGVGMAVDLCNTAGRYEHMIVDEVQDLRPAEWWILDKLLKPQGRWSLFGDMNQRRADVTWSTWEELLDQCELDRTDGEALSYEELMIGYRSTHQILRFAGRLLTVDQRNLTALRHGLEPIVRKVNPRQLAAEAAQQALSLSEEFHDGQVGVIASDLKLVKFVQGLLYDKGWTPAPGPRSTLALYDGSKFTRQVMVTRPVYARGLEFDGVVVVEPVTFQKNRGRHGSLYTSLTRANKKLVVVHSKPLPQELQGRVRPDPARR